MNNGGTCRSIKPNWTSAREAPSAFHLYVNAPRVGSVSKLSVKLRRRTAQERHDGFDLNLSPTEANKQSVEDGWSAFYYTGSYSASAAQDAQINAIKNSCRDSFGLF